jgi:O-antigen ligase
VAFLWGAPWRQGEALRIVRAVQRAALAVALAVVVLLFTYPEAFLGRIAVYTETLDPRSPKSELVARTHDYPLAEFLKAFDNPRWPYGFGLGTASLGGQYVSRFFMTQPPEGPVESGYGDIILETGILGLILWIVMSSAVVVTGWKVARKLRGSPFFPLAFMIVLYSFLLLFPMTFTGIQAYQDFVLNCYLWLLIGILFRLPSLELSAQADAASKAYSARTISSLPRFYDDLVRRPS